VILGGGRWTCTHLVLPVRRDVLAVAGEIDVHSVSQLEAALAVARSSGTWAVVDLSEVTFLGVCGVRALHRASRRCRAAGAGLALVSPGTLLTRVVAVLGWAELLPVYPSLEEALAAALVEAWWPPVHW
jgi:anti-anti-sigma factor